MTSDDSSVKILIENILSSNFTGLSGEISFKEGRLLQTPILRIINVLGKKDTELDFWLPGFGFSKSLEIENDTRERNSRTGLVCAVIWPGDLSKRDPKGWAMPTDSKRLKILFEEVRKVLGYALPYDFYPVNSTYEEMINGVYNKTYDAVVGDVTMLAGRSKLVEFTQPYARSGLSMIVPAKFEESAWMFMRPFTWKMWVVTGAIFLYTMLIVWLLEHKQNPEFKESDWHCSLVHFFFPFLCSQ
ncbi:hypothetical protein QYF36_009074 [Acer negundo]|nr:hypothetical protein QYF36_009074 [Acer negundo]